jgi:hypothetical protein
MGYALQPLAFQNGCKVGRDLRNGPDGAGHWRPEHARTSARRAGERRQHEIKVELLPGAVSHLAIDHRHTAASIFLGVLCPAHLARVPATVKKP